MVMKILVTGSEGYIGAVLVPVLVKRGHQVTGVDTCFYTDGMLYQDPSSQNGHRVIENDIRRITVEDLTGFDAVVHLAELSNDPLGQHDEKTTYDINHLGSVRLAQLSKMAGVSRFVYTSSCSVYGIQVDDEVKTEESETYPQTAYARCKVLVERDVAALADDTFTPTFLRNATAYGPSPRMRFDIVLNNLSGLAWTTRQIKMTSDGTPWRPLVHVSDICDAVACTLDAPREAVHNQVFNVGDSRENYRIRKVAEIVSDTFPGCELSLGTTDGDNRSYRVSFDKINAELPGFACRRNLETGAQQLLGVFSEIDMTGETFGFRAFTRLKQLEYLISMGKLDDRFFWRAGK